MQRRNHLQGASPSRLILMPRKSQINFYISCYAALEQRMQTLYIVVFSLPAILLITVVPVYAQDSNATDSAARTAALRAFRSRA